jgi:SAM-dependent methyltransferase
MVDVARTAVPEAADRIGVALAEELPFADGAFDVVIAIAVLEYTDLEAALRELIRVLRPGGRALIGLRGCLAPVTVWRRGVAAPLARPVKRVLGIGRSTSGSRPIDVRQLEDASAELDVEIEHVERFGAAVLVDPFQRLFEDAAFRAAHWAERRPRARKFFATQRIVVIRKS